MFKSFHKHHKNPVNSNTALDWLRKMSGALRERIKTNFSLPGSDHKQLAALTVLHCLETAHKIVEIAPKSAVALGDILVELRLYFGSVWQVYLLTNYSDKEKVSHLYGWVNWGETKIWEAFFANNKGIEALMCNVVRNHNHKKAIEATQLYINRNGSNFTTGMENLLDEFSKIMQERVSNLSPAADRYFVEIAFLVTRKVSSILSRETFDLTRTQFANVLYSMYCLTLDALNNDLLTKFDFEKCTVIRMPDDFYETP